MNLGIADAAELAARMVEGELAGYSASRHAVGAKTIALSESARRALTSPKLLSRVMRTVAFGVINVFPPLQRRLARQFLDG